MNISVDGGTATAVNTYATSAINRAIVWQRQLTVGTHSIKITNAGTTGRSRVDVDSLLLTDTAGGPAPEPEQYGVE